jgi:hypothetical protein
VVLGHGLLRQALQPPPGTPALRVAARDGLPLAMRLLAPQRLAPQPPALAEALPQRTAPPRVPAAAVAVPLPAARPVDPGPAPVGSAELPVYATRLPDPVQLHYRLQRGGQVGAGRLQWQHGDAGYELRLDVEWPGQPAQGSASRGQIGAEGVAPLRHAELRRARELRAVNFQREAATITFSGPQGSYALPPGAQDRLNWMIQLPAILEADAAFARAGAAVTLFVAGTRGDAEAWRFEVLGHEALELPAGTVPKALQMRREPTRPYDTRVEVWFDPARQHLPVRAVFTTLPGGQPLQLELAVPDIEAQAGLEKAAAAPR